MKIFMTILAVASFLLSCNADVFIVYGEDSNIYVRSSAGSLVKQFHISSSLIKGIAIHYEEDLIFAVDGNKIFKLYLLDNEGKPKKSGSGQLFLNAKASHFESVLLVLSDAGIQPTSFSSEATSLTVDQRLNKLYICGRDYVFEMDYSGKNVRKVIGTDFGAPLATFYFNHLIFHGNKAYVEVYSSSSSHRHNNGIYQTVIDPSGMNNVTNKSLVLEKANIYSMATDNTSKNIFYVENEYQIRLLQPEDDKQHSAPLSEVPIVISNFGVTRFPKALAVTGRNMFWSSPNRRQIWFGKLTENKNFLPLQNVSEVTSTQTYQLAVFETSSSGKSFGIFNSWFVLMLGLLNIALNLL